MKHRNKILGILSAIILVSSVITVWRIDSSFDSELLAVTKVTTKTSQSKSILSAYEKYKQTGVAPKPAPTKTVSSNDPSYSKTKTSTGSTTSTAKTTGDTSGRNISGSLNPLSPQQQAKIEQLNNDGNHNTGKLEPYVKWDDKTRSFYIDPVELAKYNKAQQQQQKCLSFMSLFSLDVSCKTVTTQTLPPQIDTSKTGHGDIVSENQDPCIGDVVFADGYTSREGCVIVPKGTQCFDYGCKTEQTSNQIQQDIQQSALTIQNNALTEQLQNYQKQLTALQEYQKELDAKIKTTSTTSQRVDIQNEKLKLEQYQNEINRQITQIQNTPNYQYSPPPQDIMTFALIGFIFFLIIIMIIVLAKRR